MMQKLQVTVTIEDTIRFEDILDAARKLGLGVEASFPRLGVATGAIEREQFAALLHLKGISSVEEQRSYRAS